ncbi:MAG: hypothetical protein ACI915_001911 [Gammaproteobacteria bacterium]|jgi:hypothetical protein
MFSPASESQIWLCCTPTDMRKSYDGLSALVRQTLRDDPLTGALYVFRQLLLRCSTSGIHAVVLTVVAQC